MGIEITCDFCSRDLDFSGDWKRLTGGRVACVGCQEIVYMQDKLIRLQRNLILHACTLEVLGQDDTMARDAALLCKTLTNTIQQLMLLSGYEF